MDRKNLSYIGIIFLIGFAFLAKGYFLGENNNIINNIDNCQQVNIIEENFRSKIFKTFSCGYHTNSNGEIGGGTCINASFNKNGICHKLIIYKKTSLFRLDLGYIYPTSGEIINVVETDPYANLREKYNKIQSSQRGCTGDMEKIDENGECIFDLDSFYNKENIDPSFPLE